MIRSQHENRKPFAPNSLKIPTRQHRCNKAAESTGKHGRGLIPLAGEPLTTPERYGSDRFFAYLELEGQADPSQRQAVEVLERAGHPVARICVKDIWHIAQEFFRWEIATAVAGAPKEEPVFREKDLALYADPRNAAELGQHNTLSGYLKGHFGRVHAGAKAGDYVALLAYIQRNKANTQALTAMRTRIRDKTHAATCLGFGPRFQHSTGQAYKGG